MVNKRIVLGILIIAFVGIAAAGTWANFVVSAQDTGNLKAGTINIALDRLPGSTGFTIDKMVPDSKPEELKFYRCGGPDYFITVRNTGDLPASLFINDTLSSPGSTLASHVTLYYALTGADDATKYPITSTSANTNTNIAAGGYQTMYMWYSYENIPDYTVQNQEMGDTVNAVVTFSLKNPDTSTAPGI